MLYLEDYLEMIENLPMEMRDKFTEMREMDLQVSNATDSLEEKVNVFFKKCGSGSVKQEWQDEQMAKIRQEYSKALEDADEKVQLGNQIYELVDRHLRKLDQEVSKFKMELEADNAGITEILERRTAESEKPIPHLNNNHRHEKHKSYNLNSSYDVVPSTKQVTQVSNSSVERHSSVSSLAAELGKETALPNTVLNITKVASTSSSVVSPLSNLTYDASQQKVPTLSTLVGSGSNAAITVAASRAIGATVEMQQGRRTASLKASFEAVKKIPKVLPMGKEVHAHSSNVVPEVKSNVKNKKSTNSSHVQSRTAANGGHHHHHHHHHNHQQQQQQQQRLPSSSEPVQPPEVPTGADEGMEVTASGWQADPNEPRYCLCNDVSYGDMVGCDNDDCPLEWFHYGCVGLQQAPRGKWYCPQCLTSMRRRGRK